MIGIAAVNPSPSRRTRQLFRRLPRQSRSQFLLPANQCPAAPFSSHSHLVASLFAPTTSCRQGLHTPAPILGSQSHTGTLNTNQTPRTLPAPKRPRLLHCSARITSNRARCALDPYEKCFQRRSKSERIQELRNLKNGITEVVRDFKTYPCCYCYHYYSATSCLATEVCTSIYVASSHQSSSHLSRPLEVPHFDSSTTVTVTLASRRF